MKLKFASILLLLVVLNSCKNENEIRIVETQREAQKREVVFSKINSNWKFYATPINATSRENRKKWQEWDQFLSELEQKPTKTIVAFQKKTDELSKKATALNNNIPENFNNAQIKSRIALLITKVKMLDLYIHLQDIPSEKVVALIPDINVQLVALQKGMDKIVQKSKIPLEDGESELLRMLDTTRAIPNESQEPNPNTPRVE